MAYNLARILIGIALIVVLAFAASAALAQSGSAQKQEQKAAAKVIDPVCNMQVDPAKAAAKSEYKGQTYYFCSDHCKRRFDAAPESFLKKPAPKK